jgi:hypothetical protein
MARGAERKEKNEIDSLRIVNLLDGGNRFSNGRPVISSKRRE